MGYGLIGSGKIKVAPYDASVPFAQRKFRDILNASKLSYSFETDTQNMPDYRSEAGGNYDSYSRINTVSVEIEVLEFTAENIAMMLWGEVTAQTAQPITGEEHKIYAGAFIPTDRIIDRTVPIVVTAGSTAIDTDDYVVSDGGITIAATISTTGVVDGDTITIDYTPTVSNDVQTLLKSSPEISIYFEGYNRNTGKPRTARLFRVKLGAMSNLDNIGTAYATAPLTCELVKDETVIGQGLSQYFSLEEQLTQ
ncbi:MAG: hypothetical protein LBE24_10650 [Methylobacillus sp.]|jgi:hypothetical protein|nr:hypothetical protein [Methylobacillus sp.]